MHGGRQVLWGWSSTVKYKLKIGTVKVNICRTAHSANPQCKTLQVVLLHFHTAQPITETFMLKLQSIQAPEKVL